MLFGLQNLMVRSVINLFSAHITINAQQEPRAKTYIPNQNSIREQIESIPGVIATVRHYLLAGSIGFDKQRNGTYRHVSGAIVAIDPMEEGRVLSIDKYLIDGQWLDEYDRDEIVLSSALAGGYGIFAPSDLGGVRVGDHVTIAYANGVTRRYHVKGIYNDAIGLFETFITTDEAESVLSVKNEATQVLVKVDLEHAALGSYVAQITNIAPSLKVQPYTVLLGAFTAFLNALDLISAIVSAISVLVAVITMFALIYIHATQRRRQIGIMKAIGIKREIVILSYVFQSLFYGICGVLVGYVFVMNVLTPYLAAHPIDLVFGKLMLVHSDTTIIVGIISLMAASFFAGLVPSWTITKRGILASMMR